MSRITLDDVMMGGRFLRQLPFFLRHRVTVEEARATLKRRLEHRETDFLALVKRAIYEHPPSPYRKLLQLAGCEYGDLERLVRQDGVEGALGALLRHGVFLTVDEFKGRQPVVRGRAMLTVLPDSLLNPCATRQTLIGTGGSRGESTMVPLDLRFVRDRAVDAALAFEGWGSNGWHHAVWGAPGGAAMIHALEFSILDAGLSRWFTMMDEAEPGLHPRYRWSTWAVGWGSRLVRRSTPRPVHVPLDDSAPIIDWMAGTLRRGAVPHLHTFASAAARLCQAALTDGRDLRGARFTMASEPTTAARLDAVRQVGAEGFAYYASIDCGPIAYGCRQPASPDDMHCLDDFQALIQAGPHGAERALPAAALLVSSLRDTAPLMLLNVSLGDQAALERRACGCALADLGWMRHVRDVRSFEKLTAAGMTFLDVDLIRVLEETLPAGFGGGPTDYQLVEEEDATGGSVLRLLVHPRVGQMDEAAVREVFLEAIGAGSGAQRVMSLAWRDVGLPRVERRPPIHTSSGKILHLHVLPLGRDVGLSTIA